MSFSFLTFGSHDNYIGALNRLVNQAKSLDLFHNIFSYTLDDLKNDSDFWSQHSSFILNNNRGCGYWIWKPYLIHKTLQSLNDGDYFLYLDSGSELLLTEKSSLLSYIEEYVNKYDLFASYFNSYATDINFNKMDLIHHFNIPTDSSLLFQPQIQATFLFFKITPSIRTLIQNWLSFISNYHLFDDTPSVIPNFHYFIEHRHDQSVLSLLIKTSNLKPFIINEKYLSCIKLIRNRSSISKFI